MTDEAGHYSASELRELAEKMADAATVGAEGWATPEEAAASLHELRVHQIEIEMQADELRRTQAELEASHARYFDLYELAPVGYLSLADTGLILEANLTAAMLLRVTRSELVHVHLGRFIDEDDADALYKLLKEVAKSGSEPYTCELRINIKGADPTWVRLDAVRADNPDGTSGIRAIVSDISRRVAAEQGLMQDAAELKVAEGSLLESEKQLKAMLAERERDLQTVSRSLTAVIDVLGQVAEARDPYTAGHQRRVAELAIAIAVEMEMTEAQIEQIRVAALMHDVGKMSVPAEILSRPGELTRVEFELIKTHSEAGHSIAVSAHLEEPIPEIILQHHERCDGSGYPRGLHADELLLQSKIIMVSDVVEAMVSHRPYRSALGIDAALDEIRQGAGRLYDAAVAAACDRVFRRGGFEFSEPRFMGAE
jgi:putative nucleotidyltransferase with HDIG domain/PAS domain S-box-containing protein